MPCRRAPVFALVSVALALIAGCNRLPLSPESSSPNPQAVTTDAAVTWTPFDLINGTMTVEGKSGTVTGTYTGRAFVSPIGQTAVFTVTITGGTGEFTNATGILKGTGTGAFTGEGTFTVVLQGTINTPDRSRKVRLALRGDAILRCSPSELIQITQSGQGTATGEGRIAGTLTHEVTNTSCQG